MYRGRNESPNYRPEWEASRARDHVSGFLPGSGKDRWGHHPPHQQLPNHREEHFYDERRRLSNDYPERSIDRWEHGDYQSRGHRRRSYDEAEAEQYRDHPPPRYSRDDREVRRQHHESYFSDDGRRGPEAARSYRSVDSLSEEEREVEEERRRRSFYGERMELTRRRSPASGSLKRDREGEPVRFGLGCGFKMPYRSEL